MHPRDVLSPAALIDRLIAFTFRMKAFWLAEALTCWCKGNHRQQFIQYRTRSGLPLWINPSNYIDRVLLVEGEHDHEVVEALGALVRDGDVLWDIGANIGYIGLSLQHRLKSLRVVAFEPSPFTFCQLFLNDRLNGERMQLFSVALADEEGFRPFSMKINRNSGQSTLEPVARFSYDLSIGVYCRTGDCLLAEGLAPAPAILKIDVEGAEYKVLKGLSNSLSSPVLRAIVFEGPTKDHSAILALLAENGFNSVKALTSGEQTNFLAQRVSSPEHAKGA